MTKVSTLPEKAGVKCPKKTKPGGEDMPCTSCEHYRKCMRALNEFIGWRL